MTPHLLLGIDTGGTYTDAVLFSEATGVVAKAKALTTRHDLAEGVSGAVETVLAKARVPVSAISLVSLSTTLATNALVEGQGGRAGLIMRDRASFHLTGLYAEPGKYETAPDRVAP